MLPVAEIANIPELQRLLAALPTKLEPIIETAIGIQQVAAPTFDEGERAKVIERLFREAGLQQVARDEAQNVYGLLRGAGENGRETIVSAHLDTVFPAGTDLTVRRNGTRIYGPGISDNSVGLAGLIALTELIKTSSIRPDGNIWLVANVGEEGLGDLNGMRTVVNRFGPDPHYIVLEGGLYGQVLHRAIAVRRYEIAVRAEGGHSWKNFGRPSAIHLISRIVGAIDDIVVPQKPWTTYNVGIISGGTSINTIAPSARAELDLRSESVGALDRLVGQVDAIVSEAKGATGAAIIMRQIGHRPAGLISRQAPIVRAAAAALRHVGCRDIMFTSGSTDANIPLSRGYSSVCIGLSNAGNVHRPDEYLETTALAAGIGQLLLLTLAVAGVKSTD